MRGGSRGGACFETGLAACQIARSCIASADCSDRDGPSILPDGLLAALWQIVDACPAECPMACVYSFYLRWARRLARRLARVDLVDLRFGALFDSRRAQRRARRLACGASADGSTFARRRTRRLAYIVSI